MDGHFEKKVNASLELSMVNGETFFHSYANKTDLRFIEFLLQ